MIARDRLMHAMAASFTDAELEAMRIAVAHVQAERAEEKARKAARTSLAANPPIPREDAPAPQETRTKSTTRVRAVGRTARVPATGTEG